MKRPKCWIFLLSSLVTPSLWAQNGDPPSVTKLHCVERAKELVLCEGLPKGKSADQFLIACLENVRKPALSEHERAANIFRKEKDDSKDEKDKKDPKQAETATYWLSDCMETYVNELELYRAQLKAELAPLLADAGTTTGTEQQSEADAKASATRAQTLTAQITALNVRLDCLRSALRLHSPDFLFQDHRAFRPWIGRFALGAEYASLNDVPDGKVFPRASLLIYRSADTWRKRQWVPNLFLDILLTSNEQRDFDPEDPTAPPAGESEEEEEEEETEEPSRSLEARGGFFLPLAKFGDTPGHERWLQEEFGPFAEYRIGYIDDQERVDRSFYGGLRLASSPQFFMDLLYGNVERLSADRIELRGQMPVTMLQNGTRLHMGFVANIKAEKTAFLKTDPAERRTEPDLIKIYFTWDVDFDDIFGWFSGGKSTS